MENSLTSKTQTHYQTQKPPFLCKAQNNGNFWTEQLSNGQKRSKNAIASIKNIVSTANSIRIVSSCWNYHCYVLCARIFLVYFCLQDEQTALHLAAPNVVTLLLNKGADIEAKDKVCLMQHFSKFGKSIMQSNDILSPYCTVPS